MRSQMSTPGAMRSSSRPLAPVVNVSAWVPSRSPQPRDGSRASAVRIASLAYRQGGWPRNSVAAHRHSRSRGPEAASNRCVRSQTRWTGLAEFSMRRRSAASRAGWMWAETRSSSRLRKMPAGFSSPRSMRLTVGWVTPSNSAACACFIPRSLHASLSVNASEQGSSRPTATMRHYKLATGPHSTRVPLPAPRLRKPRSSKAPPRAGVDQDRHVKDLERQKRRAPGARPSERETFQGTRASANTSGPDFSRA